MAGILLNANLLHHTPSYCFSVKKVVTLIVWKIDYILVSQQVVHMSTIKRLLRFLARSSDNNHVNSAAQNVLFAVVSE